MIIHGNDNYSSIAFLESFIFPLSKPMSFTLIISPSVRTSETFSTLSEEISET